MSREDGLGFRLSGRLRGRPGDRLGFPCSPGRLRGFPCTCAVFRAGARSDIYASAGDCPVSRSRSGDPLSLVCALLPRCADGWRLPRAARRGYLCALRLPLGFPGVFACRVVASRRRFSIPAGRLLAAARLARSTLAGLSYAAQPSLSRRLADRRDHAQLDREGI